MGVSRCLDYRTVEVKNGGLLRLLHKLLVRIMARQINLSCCGAEYFRGMSAFQKLDNVRAVFHLTSSRDKG